MTEPSKIFYSCFSRNEATGKPTLIYSTYGDQGFFIYDINTKTKKYILTCYFVLIVERVPGTNDYFVVGNDKPNYIRMIKEKDGYERDEYIQVKDQVHKLKVTQSHIIIEYESGIDIRLIKDITKVLFESPLCTSGVRPSDICIHPKGIAAFGGNNPGEVMLCDLRGEKIIATTFCEHKNPVTAIAISPDGTTVASVSEKGTVIKLYKTPLSQGVTQGFAYLHEIRRGKMFADVYSLSFSPDGKLVALISSTRTVHVFYTEYCYFNNKRSCETLLKSAGHFIDMTFLDNNNICLLYHEDGVLRVSSIDDLPKLNNNFASVL